MALTFGSGLADARQKQSLGDISAYYMKSLEDCTYADARAGAHSSEIQKV
jgi:hypothetical protein